MVDEKILIGYTTGEYARRADFYDFILTMDKPPGTLILPSHDRSPAYGRNLLISAAKDLNCGKVLLVDDDTVPPKDGLMKLLEHDKDIITGLYLSRGYPHAPLIFDLVDDDGAALNCYLDGPQPRLKKVVNAGLGFVLFKTEIFDRLEKPWIRLGEHDPEQWCDDIGFFNRVTAAGINIYCDMECCVGHIGTMIVTPEFKDEQWHTVYNTGANGFRIPQVVPNLKYEFKEPV